MKLTASFVVLGMLILGGCGVFGEAGQETGERAPDLEARTESGSTERQPSPEQPPAQEKGPDQGAPTNDREPTTAVAASCAAGTPQADVVAKGTVENVVVRDDFSIVEVRVTRLLEGNAANTLLIRTRTGARVATSTDVRFDEGTSYLLYLKRRGSVYTSNICSGTRALPDATQEVGGTIGSAGALAQPMGEPPVNPSNFVLERDGTVIVDGDEVTNCRSLGTGLEQGVQDSEVYRKEARKVLAKCRQLDISSGGDMTPDNSEVVLEISGAGFYPR
ncbi:MAG: hypothetical protein WA990_08430 [Rubrobacteraceae bacterium]